jgi:hypothetical protein
VYRTFLVQTEKRQIFATFSGGTPKIVQHAGDFLGVLTSQNRSATSKKLNFRAMIPVPSLRQTVQHESHAQKSPQRPQICPTAHAMGPGKGNLAQGIKNRF